MGRVDGSGRVGGTQFDDQVVNGCLSTDWPYKPTVRHVMHCDLCPKVFLPDRFDEHMETVHGTPAKAW
jgi:hypothetical protein